MKKLKGKFSLSRWTGNGEQKHGVSITIEDENSGCNVVEVELTVEDFAQALFGSSYQNCNITVYDVYERFGMFPIRKSIWVEYKSYERDSEKVREFAKNSVKIHEKDGWNYSSHQLGNSHYSLRDGSNRYPVTLIKFVNTIEEQEAWKANKEAQNIY